jgi:branched-chain amino acid transport system permease protein
MLILIFIYSAWALSWNLLFGQVNQLNFGYMALAGVGAYTSALLAIYFNFSPLLGIFIGGTIATLVALPIGVACLRLGGAYMAIATLAYGEILRLIIARPLEWLTRGYCGLWGIPNLPSIKMPFLGTINFTLDRRPFYYFTLTTLLLSIFILYKLTKSKIGFIFHMIRRDETAAKCLGIDTIKYKIISWVISSFLAGMFGGIYAHYIQTLTPDILSISLTFELLTMTLIGGFEYFLGPPIGVCFVTLIKEVLRPIEAFRFIIYGLLVVVIIIFFPSGLAGIYKRLSIKKGVIQIDK